MKISTSFAPSRSRRMVEAGRDADVSGMLLTCGARLRLEVGALVDAGNARQEIVDLRLGRRRDGRARLALGAGSDDAALLQHMLAHGKARAGLLLVADQWQMRVEQVMRGVALARLGQVDDVDQKLREGIAGHGAIGAALHLEVQEQPAIAAEDRERTERTVLLKVAEGRDLLQPRPVL